MRIDAMSKVSQLYQSNTTKKVAKTESARRTDRVEISRAGMEFQIAQQAVHAAPDIREDKVQALKEQMQAGTYNISMDDLAEKLLNGIF